jgi:hypothetical protein
VNVRPELPLVVEGRTTPSAARAFVVAALLGFAGGTVAALPVIAEYLASLVETSTLSSAPRWPLELPVFGWGFALFVLLPLGTFLGLRAIEARSGRVTFREDVIEIEKGRSKRTLRWSSVSAYRARSAAFVQLHASGARFSLPGLAVPTPTEDDRARVIDLLDARGIPRKD